LDWLRLFGKLGARTFTGPNNLLLHNQHSTVSKHCTQALIT